VSTTSLKKQDEGSSGASGGFDPLHGFIATGDVATSDDTV